MFDQASKFPWVFKGNIVYREDRVGEGQTKLTEIARFRVFQVQEKSKLKGVSVEEAHENAELVAHALELHQQMDDFLKLVEKQGTPRLVEKASRLRAEFYAKGSPDS